MFAFGFQCSGYVLVPYFLTLRRVFLRQQAMENKGLNVFNTAYVLADEKTATDVDFERVEGVIGHEVRHYERLLYWSCISSNVLNRLRLLVCSTFTTGLAIESRAETGSSSRSRKD
jgi:Peptidase family M1 domain